VAVAGAVDVRTALKVRAALEDSLESQSNALVLDFAAVTFIDSTGLTVVMAARRRLADANRGFAVAAPPGPPRRIFEVTGLDEKLMFAETVEAAIELVST
jgi:anti-sigma B factor antagonist